MNALRSRVLAVAAGAAVVVGLGAGGAVAGSLTTGATIKNGTVRSVDLANGRVFGRDLHNNSVHKQDVGNNSVGRSELVEGSVGAYQLSDWVRNRLSDSGPQGARGPAGEQGPAGDDGSDGQDGVSGYEVIGRGTDAVTVEGTATVVSKCAEGEKVLSGGVKGGDVTVKESYPSDVVRVGPNTEADPAGLWAATSWTSVVEGTGTVQPFLVCADIAG